MSRAPPFPTSSSRRAPNGLPSNPFPNSNDTTLPLTINRGSRSRPESPDLVSSRGTNAPGSSPARPMRSERRPRQISQHSEASTSSSRFRESVTTSQSDAPFPQEDTVSPKALGAVMNAFQSAGQARKRANTAGDREREIELAKEKERRERIREKEPGRRANGKSRGAGEIDAVLDQIQDEWAFAFDPDFNPVDLALALLDNSSLGKDLNSFRKTKAMLERSLKGTVDKHYQSFAAALPHHAALLNSLSATQTQIVDARSRLQEARESLGNKRADLVQLWARSQTIEEMMKLLDEIDYLKSVPDLLETCISEKRLLQAAVLLVRSLKVIGKQDMLEIGAVADLRSYLTGQETALRDILIEELHGHMYLKVFWCDSRWAIYKSNQQMLPAVDFDELSPDHSQLSNDAPRQLRLSRFLNELALRPNDPPLDTSESPESTKRSHTRSNSFPTSASAINLSDMANNVPSSQNPESDSFAYIEMLLESLSVLGKLGSGLDTVSQRLPIEIYSLVETTLEEVQERAEFAKRMSLLSPLATTALAPNAYIYTPVTPGADSSRSLRLTALESSSKEADHEILRDFFWTLYSKLDAVMQSLRVVYEVANRIGSRRDFKDSSGAKPGALFPLVEIWQPIQMEVRTLLHDYLTDADQSSKSGRNPIASINEVLREGKYSRDRNKPVFRFGDSDSRSTVKALRRHEDELTRVLKETVPGLVNGPLDGTIQSPLSSLGTDDRFVSAGSHRPLVHPDAFHVTVLFQPTLTFLDRVAEVLPSDLSESVRASSTVLDEFVLNVYLPQLEEKVFTLFHQAVSGPDAFQEDSGSKRLSSRPLVKASTQLMALINSLCAMLRTTPFHRENYSRLILGVIIQFYQRCSDRFRYLVSRDDLSDVTDTNLAVAARWAQKAEVAACLTGLYATPPSDISQIQRLCRQETRVELNFLTTDTIAKDDLIRSTRHLAALANLYQSLTWFVAQLQALKTVSEDPTSPVTSQVSPDAAAPDTEVTPFSAGRPILPPPPSDSNRLKLPLTAAMAQRFDALMKTYDQLAEMILCTIRIDIRCRTIHFLDLAMRQGNYCIDQEATEPDQHIIDLNIDLGACDDSTITTLPEKERHFIFQGLGTLVEHLLIANSRHIRFVNALGVRKILRNLLALQQNLKTITDVPQDAEFERAKKYYGLYSLTPSQMLASIRQQPQFTFDEYKSMLNFQCGVDQALVDQGASQTNDKDYNMYLIDLHAMAIGDWMEESGGIA